MSDSERDHLVEKVSRESDDEHQASEDGSLGDDNPAQQPPSDEAQPNDINQGDQAAQRARRAQRTRRTKVNPSGAGNPAGGGSSGENSSVENIHQKVNAQPTHAAPKRPFPVNNPGGAGKKQPPTPPNKPPSSESNPAPKDSTPVIFPPVIGMEDGDICEDDFDYECDSSGEPSKLVSWLRCFTGRVLSALGKVLGLIKWVFMSIIGAFKSIFGVFNTPVLLGVLSYVAVVYVVGTYVLNEYNGETDFSSMSKYVIRCCMWNLIPVVMALVMVQTTGNAKHNQFLYEGILDVILSAANGLLLVSHDEQGLRLHWLTAIASVSVVYRFLYWISLFRMSNKWRRSFGAPSTLNITVLFLYNACSVFTANFGCPIEYFYGGGETAASAAPSVESAGYENAATQTESAPSGEPGWF